MRRRGFFGALLGLAASAVAIVLPKPKKKRYSVETETVTYKEASSSDIAVVVTGWQETRDVYSKNPTGQWLLELSVDGKIECLAVPEAVALAFRKLLEQGI